MAGMRRPWRVGSTNMRLRVRAGEMRRLGDAGMRKLGVGRYRQLVAIPALMLLVILVAWIKMPQRSAVYYRPSEETIVNPLSGWAVSALDRSGRIDTSLIYAQATWRELEPEPGVFDFESFERENHLYLWWAEGKRLILRLVADVPGDADHMDIPDWLYELTGDGTFYDTDAGGGYAPNYGNRILRERHHALIHALGARYSGHPGIAFVEIGSLGADGLWRAGPDPDVPVLPASPIARRFIAHYSSAFEQTPMLLPNPYREARRRGLGIFCPVLGDAAAAWAHFDTVANGGYDPETAADLYPMGAFWLRAPAGGQIAPDVDAHVLFTDELMALMAQMREGHITYAAIGRSTEALPQAAIEGMRQATRAMGYRLWIRSARWEPAIARGYRLTVELTVRNDGVAPPYGVWEPMLALRKDGHVALSERLYMEVIAMKPGQSEFRVWIDIPADFEAGDYELVFGLIDPATGKPAIRLAMESCGDDLWTALGDVSVRRASD